MMSLRSQMSISSILGEGCSMWKKMGRGIVWLDTGTHEFLNQASPFIETVEKRQGLKIACIEEIACRMGRIVEEQVEKLADPLNKNDYA